MARFLIDECTPKQVVQAIRDWNAANPHETLDVVVVGEPPDLPNSSPDPDILIWAERDGRIVLTVDYSTMPVHLTDHLAAGRHSPGVLCVRRGSSMDSVIESLVIVAYAGRPDDLADTLAYIPF